MSAKIKVQLDATKALADANALKKAFDDAARSFQKITAQAASPATLRGLRAQVLIAQQQLVLAKQQLTLDKAKYVQLRSTLLLKKQETAMDRAHGVALRMNKRLQEQMDRAHGQALHENQRRQERADREAERAIQRRMRLEEHAQRARERSIARLSRSNFGTLGPALSAGVSRLGGVFPDSITGYTLRQGVTGMFLGQGAGGVLGSAASGLFRGAGVGVSRMLPGAAGGILGKGLGLVGGVAGSMLPLAGMYQGAKMGATYGLVFKTFESAVGVFQSAVGMLLSGVRRLFDMGMGWAKLAARMGVVGGVGATIAGVGAYSRRVSSESALQTVAGREAPGLATFATQLAGQNSLFTRSSLIGAATRGSAFGLSPNLIRQFLPLMTDASALFGREPEEGLRALARAVYQREPEAAEAFGLNLYEKNIKQMFPNLDMKDYNQQVQGGLMAAYAQLQRFQGAQARQRLTPGGAIQAFKNRSIEGLESFGKGFTEGFGLIERLNKASDNLIKNMPMLERVGHVLGQGFGKLADFASENIPGVEQLKEFFSLTSESTKASQWGDAMREAIYMALGTMKTFWDYAKAIKNEFIGPSGLIEGLKSGMDAFVSKWPEYIRFIGESIAQLVDLISKQIDSAFGSMTKAVARSAVNSWAGQLGAAGSGLGGLFGSLGGPPGVGAGVIAGGTLGATLGTVLDAMGVPALQVFDKGGVVPGPEGKPVNAVVHAGEVILNKAQQQKVFGPRHRYQGGTLDPSAYANLPHMGFTLGPMPLNRPTHSTIKAPNTVSPAVQRDVTLAGNMIRVGVDKIVTEMERLVPKFQKFSSTVDNTISSISENAAEFKGKGEIGRASQAISDLFGGDPKHKTPESKSPGSFPGVFGQWLNDNQSVIRQHRAISAQTVIQSLRDNLRPDQMTVGLTGEPDAYNAFQAAMGSRMSPGQVAMYKEPWGNYSDDFGITTPNKIDARMRMRKQPQAYRRKPSVAMDSFQQAIYGNIYFRGDSNDLMRLAGAPS